MKRDRLQEQQTATVAVTAFANDYDESTTPRPQQRWNAGSGSRITSKTSRLALFQLPLLLLVAFLSVLPLAAAYKELSDDVLRQVPGGDEDDFEIHNGELLAPLLIPRVPGTPGQVKAQEHFVKFFKRWLPQWEISWQNSTQKTPLTKGDETIPFQNLIFRREPAWTKGKPGKASYLTLVAHYDSLIKPEGFIGATDSAAPCAVLLHVARSVDKYLTQVYEARSASQSKNDGKRDVGVQILLLDGEEAFVRWTDTDSLYGARSLAEEWENTPYPAMSTFRNPMRQIELFVLLDLLGAANPDVPSYFMSTHWAYKKMAGVEARLRKLGLLESEPKQPFFPEAGKKKEEFYPPFIGDDHVPFMARGAPTLHLIPEPFPKVWHTADDDGEHLDIPTVKDWAKIVTAFTMEYMDVMDVLKPAEKGTAAGDDNGKEKPSIP